MYTMAYTQNAFYVKQQYECVTLKTNDGFDQHLGGYVMKKENPVYGTGEVDEKLIDAISGATWGERNRLMQKCFKQKLRSNDGSVPQFCPPGTKMEKSDSE